MISEAFSLIAEVALSLGETPISKHVDCWELDVDGTWWVAVNGHPEPRTCSRGVTVQPFECYLEYGAFPAGFLAHNSGIMVAGEVANEDTLIAALRARLEAAQAKGSSCDACGGEIEDGSCEACDDVVEPPRDG